MAQWLVVAVMALAMAICYRYNFATEWWMFVAVLSLEVAAYYLFRMSTLNGILLGIVAAPATCLLEERWITRRAGAEAESSSERHGSDENGSQLEGAVEEAKELRRLEQFSNEILGRAITFLGEGKKWRDIYPACIDGYSALPPSVRRAREHQLRERTRRFLVKAMKSGG